MLRIPKPVDIDALAVETQQEKRTRIERAGRMNTLVGIGAKICDGTSS